MIKPLIIGALVCLYLQLGLEPTAWLFYELSHATGFVPLYNGYSAFRGAGYFYSLWPWQLPVNLLVGVLVAALVYWLQQRRQA